MNNFNCKELRRAKEYRINKMIDTKVMLNIHRLNIIIKSKYRIGIKEIIC